MLPIWLVCFLTYSPVYAAQQPSSAALTPEQQALFTAARQDFGNHHPELALEKMKHLHGLLPGNPEITDGTAETALATGDANYAVSLLKPALAAHQDDSLALELLARAYAASGDSSGRDQAIAAVLTLHTATAEERFKRQDRFLVERTPLPSGSLEIYVAIVPFSPYHIYMLGRQLDAHNTLVRQITLESNDMDQVAFAKERPDMAMKGMRRFSVDTYSPLVASPNGASTQTQGLITFIDGQPDYDTTKALMLKVALGDTSPVAIRDGLPLQSTHQ